jgi:cysteine desulfurase family protein
MDMAYAGRRIYLDNAATSYPKPPKVWDSMERYMRDVGASPGRGGYESSLGAGRIVYEARESAARLFHAPAAEQVIFAPNVTYALNFAVHGLLRHGDHVVTTSMEHNSVMRPLRFSEEHRGVEITEVECDIRGSLDPEDVRCALRPHTRMIAITHASNVSGTVMPIAEIANIAREAGVFMMVDAAQTAGAIPIDLRELGADVLAFTGHKGLYGPPGTGGMVLSPRAATQMLPLVQGGTGSRSDEEVQPGFLPDRFEPGTPNTVGIAGLAAGIGFVLENGAEQIGLHELRLADEFAQMARGIPGVRVFGPWGAEMGSAAAACALDRVATVSAGFTSPLSDPARAAYLLDRDFGIMVRSGLHCAPAAHRTLGTFPVGTLRFSFGWFNTMDDARDAAIALARIVSEEPSRGSNCSTD